MKILIYCQHVLGIGHLFRTIEICKALHHHDVLLVTGGPPVETALPRHVREFRLRPPENGYQTRFYPLYAYGDQITPTADDSYLISTSITNQGLGFSENIDTLRTIFD